MANFDKSFDVMIENEGGFVDHTVAGDKGGRTYAGIASASWPNWEGWSFLNRGEKPPVELVKAFYKKEFWDKLMLDGVVDDNVATTIFDFAVNTGSARAARIAQRVVGVADDGVFGNQTLKALNDMHPELFVCKFALAKVDRYRRIVAADRSQEKFMLGWLNRTLKGIV